MYSFITPVTELRTILIASRGSSQTPGMFTSRIAIAAPFVRNKPPRGQIRSFSKFDLYGNSPIPEGKLKYVPSSGIYPLGFRVGSVKAGIKPESSPQRDLILVASDRASCGAAVFTKNEFPAPSVTVSREIVKRCNGHGIQGIIANSGCANLFTGHPGLEDARMMGEQAADHLADGLVDEGLKPSVLVMHTGAGGQR